MNDSINKVVATCSGLIVSNETWKTLGFRKCPKYGAFFQKFRTEWKVQLEKKILQETLAAFTAVYVVENIITPQEVSSIVAQYTHPDVARALGYSSVAEAEQSLTQSIAKYYQTPVKDWAELLLKRFVPASIPDKKCAARLFVGCVVFAQNISHMMLVVRTSHN